MLGTCTLLMCGWYTFSDFRLWHLQILPVYFFAGTFEMIATCFGGASTTHQWAGEPVSNAYSGTPYYYSFTEWILVATVQKLLWNWIPLSKSQCSSFVRSLFILRQILLFDMTLKEARQSASCERYQTKRRVLCRTPLRNWGSIFTLRVENEWRGQDARLVVSSHIGITRISRRLKSSVMCSNCVKKPVT